MPAQSMSPCRPCAGKADTVATVAEEVHADKENNINGTTPAVPTAHEELFKKFFLKGQDKEDYFKMERAMASVAMSELVDRLRSEVIELALDTFGGGSAVQFIREYWNGKPHDIRDGSSAYFHVPASFQHLKEFISEEDYDKHLSSVAQELETIFQSNGMYCVEVDVYSDGPLGDRLVVSNMFKFFHEYGKKCNGDPPKHLTGLEGKCSVCLEDDTKLFALAPCGHTVCLDCTSDFIGKECPTCKQHVHGKQGVFPN